MEFTAIHQGGGMINFRSNIFSGRLGVECGPRSSICLHQQLTFSKHSNMYDSVLGIIPLSAYRSAPPVMVNVLPDPVCNMSSSLVQ